MPAIITHHLFGEDAAGALPEGILTGQEDLLAFLLGNQGPDPLWARFRTKPKAAKACHELANRMHEGQVTEALISLRESVLRLPEDDKTVGRAFVLGMAAHYLLDSMAHPLIYALQEQLCQIDPSLAPHGSEVHAIIEADIDSWMLWQTRQQSVLDAPCTSALICTKRIERVSGALVSRMASEVFGIDVTATDYGQAVGDYRLFYALIDPPDRRALALLSRMELLVRPVSRLLAQAHPVIDHDTTVMANLEHATWRNPSTDEVSTASLPDLFHDALVAWPAFSQRLASGSVERLEAMVAHIDYNGRPYAP